MFKILTPYIEFSGDSFAFVAVKKGADLEKIEHELNKEGKYEGSHLIPVLEFSEDYDTAWWEEEFSLYIHVLMWG